MNSYETLIIFKSQVSDQDIEAFLEKVIEKIQASGGAIEKNQKMGRRRLPYRFQRFKNQHEGSYVHLLFKGASSLPAELQAMFKISEEIMRYFVVRFDPTINTIPQKKPPREMASPLPHKPAMTVKGAEEQGK